MIWNIHAIINDPDRVDDLLNRTNNPLERFNRELNMHFATAHPTMAQLVECLKTMSQKYVTRLGNIRLNQDVAPVHSHVPNIHPIPVDYATFEF